MTTYPYAALRALLFRVSPERAHRLALSTLSAIQGTPIEGGLARWYHVRDDRLRVSAFGHTFENPVGVAAGLDKNARAPNALAALGFGHVEVGGVTATPQAGNPRPRLFRLVADRALINRMGFNNEGAAVVGDRLRALPKRRAPIGVNLGKSKDVPLESAADDYRRAYEAVADVGDYFVINVSSPNTPGLRTLQARDALEAIVGTLRAADANPLLIKLSPDLEYPAIDEVIEVATSHDLAGLIAVNTTIDRPDSLTGVHRDESGGLSGAPLQPRARELVSYIATRTDRPVIGVGGVDGPDAAYQLIRQGASLVQLYTGLVYEGPGLIKRINQGLLSRLERDGFDSIEAARGVDL